jgi:multiple sugar transport system permease protein
MIKSGYFERNLKYIFPLPALLFVLLLMVLKDPRFIAAFGRTFYFTTGAVLLEAVLGTAIALVLHREFTGKNTVKFILLLPLVSTPVAIGIVWNLFYDPTIGFLNYCLSLLGLPQSGWVTEATTVLPSLILVDVWQWTPMIALIVLAGLAGLSSEPYESAKVDGANSLQVLWYITFPMLMPTILTGIVLRAVDALKTFDIIYAMTGGGPGYASETINIMAFKFSFEYFDLGSASAI